MMVAVVLQVFRDHINRLAYDDDWIADLDFLKVLGV